ncbi:MAG: hypothetical protein Q4E32_06145, partial [Bacteroidales bacterium]|nr:hypothetical protein [Bacteroidales bacterium]
TLSTWNFYAKHLALSFQVLGAVKMVGFGYTRSGAEMLKSVKNDKMFGNLRYIALPLQCSTKVVHY